MKIEELPLCGHTKRCLQHAGLTTAEELEQASDRELLQIRGIGKVIVSDIRKALACRNSPPDQKKKTP